MVDFNAKYERDEMRGEMEIGKRFFDLGIGKAAIKGRDLGREFFYLRFGRHYPLSI